MKKKKREGKYLLKCNSQSLEPYVVGRCLPYPPEYETIMENGSQEENPGLSGQASWNHQGPYKWQRSRRDHTDAM
jgi:hypothetical protein